MKDRINNIKDRIKKAASSCGRNPDEVLLVAVSKKKPADMVLQAIECGQTLFGENYIQESLEKIEAISSDIISWHFIGHLQSNKAKFAVKVFDLIHTVDSLKLAKEINRQAEKINKTQQILVQVNISKEGSKSGIYEENAIELIEIMSTLPNVSIKGLMTMPPYYDDPDNARPYFASLKRLSEKVKKENIPRVEMKELSMGMTGDFETAIQEGATLVRIGTAIFGERF